jgi:NAD/NADP transhydrogenase beta subunit
MNWLTKLNTLFAPRELSRARIAMAVTVAVLADLLQIVLLPVAWTATQQVIDVVAMLATTFLLGFHLLLLPTFAVEFIPVVDMLPTWTGCVIAVIALRKRAGSNRFSNDLPGGSPSPGKPPRQIGSDLSDRGDFTQ